MIVEERMPRKMSISVTSARCHSISIFVCPFFVLIASAAGVSDAFGKPSDAVRAQPQRPDTGASVERWGLFETSLTNARSYRNPFADVTLTATFVAPSGKKTNIEGFYDGGKTWRIRFMPDEVGRWKYEARFSDGSGRVHGVFQCVAGRLHGPLRVYRKNPLWFAFADNVPVYLLSFHLWNVDDLDEEILAKTLDYLKARGFNAIVGPHLLRNRMVWARDAKGNIDFTRFDLRVWRGLDRALRMTAERNMILIPFSIVGGTNGLPKPRDSKSLDMLLHYWVARWGGFWNATFQPTSEWEEGYKPEEIRSILARIHELDHGRHLLSVHNLKAGNAKLQKSNLLSYVTVQDKLTKWNPEKYVWLARLYRKVRKPIFAHECLWEGNIYQTKAGLDVDNMRKAAWVIALCGGQINYADEVVPPRRWQHRGELNVTFSECGMKLQPRGKLYPALLRLADFLRSQPFWRMTPQPQLCSTRICLCEPGVRYVAWCSGGKPFSLDLPRTRGNFTARWFDPRNGKLGDPMRIKGGGKRNFAPPDSRDWVLLVLADQAG